MKIEANKHTQTCVHTNMRNANERKNVRRQKKTAQNVSSKKKKKMFKKRRKKKEKKKRNWAQKCEYLIKHNNNTSTLFEMKFYGKL